MGDSRPIMGLLHKLIDNDGRQNLVLKNAEIYSMLQKEFDMNIKELHPLEISIYLNVVKSFLKDWPHWDKLDSMVNKFKKNKTKPSHKLLEYQYKNLKAYLHTAIEDTKPMAMKAVTDLPTDLRTNPKPSAELNNIVLEICSTRKQLNDLLYNKPNNSMFVPSNDRKIVVQNFPIESILNYPDVKLTIDLKFFKYIRCTKHDYRHLLVNNKVPEDPANKITLKTDIQRKSSDTSTTIWSISQIISSLDNISQAIPDGNRCEIDSVLNVIRSDFEGQDRDHVKAPVVYRQYNSKYPYIRKICKPVEMDEDDVNSKYDLVIKETISPMHMFNILKMTPGSRKKPIPHNFSWLKIECTFCKVTFTGEHFNEKLVEHYKENHADEQDWSCTNCQMSFTMVDLSSKKWRHECFDNHE